MTDAQFVREALETASLRDAVGRAEEEDLAELRGLLAEQLASAAGLDAFFALDEAFHARLMAAGGHGSAWDVVGSAKAHLDRVRRLSLPLPHTVERLIAEHHTIVDRVAAGEAEAAETALRDHVRTVFTDLEQLRDQTPDLFSDDADAGRRPRRQTVTAWEARPPG